MAQPLLADWRANRGNCKGQLVLVLFRAAALCREWRGLWRVAGWPVLVLYRLGVEWLLGIELRCQTRVGPRLRLFHGQGLVVHEGAVLGADCVLRQSTTIGNRTLADGAPGPCPVLGDGVEVGANVVLLGGIRIGDRAVIGAGSVVVRDVPAGATVAGNPARVLKDRFASEERP